MGTAQELSILLAKSSMLEGEREAWVKLIPLLTPEEISKLFVVLEKDVDRTEAIKKEYREKFQEVIRNEEIRQVKTKLS